MNFWSFCILLITVHAVQCSPLEQVSSESQMATSTSRTDKKTAAAAKDDEHTSASKNTLADQVAMGKYGLIQKEIFSAPSPRPGVLSYAANEEVPKDLQV